MTRGLLIIALITGTFLFPGAARAQDDAQAYAGKAIAPAVVRQGGFAVRLAEALALGTAPDDEADALHALAALGVQPVGGWFPDYAMTPQTVAELRAALADAKTAGRVAMELDAMWTAFNGLLAELGLPLPAEPPPAYVAGPPVGGYGPYCDTRTTHYFYGSYGLPIYSYCYPPSAFIHYYSWVPCGFRAHGHYFAGFFILRQVHVIPRAHHPRHVVKHFDDDKHKSVHKPERRLRVVQPPTAIHPAPPRDAKSGISGIQSGVMEHKSEIMQRLPRLQPPRTEPLRPVPGRAVRSGERVAVAPPRRAPVAHSPRVPPVQREAAPPRMAILPAVNPAPVTRPVPGAVAPAPSRHAPPRAAAPWSPRPATSAETRAPARDTAAPRARFGSR